MPRSLTVATQPQGMSRAVEAFIGGFLELVIHSVEELRARVVRTIAR